MQGRFVRSFRRCAELPRRLDVIIRGHNLLGGSCRICKKWIWRFGDASIETTRTNAIKAAVFSRHSIASPFTVQQLSSGKAIPFQSQVRTNHLGCKALPNGPIDYLVAMQTVIPFCHKAGCIRELGLFVSRVQQSTPLDLTPKAA